MGRAHKTQQSFIDEVKAVHGDRYDYSLSVYTDTKTKITVICKTHGTFLITPKLHLSGSGCRECGHTQRVLKRTGTVEDFLDRATEKHANKYTYSLVDYKNTKSKITVICPVHGSFIIRANSHLSGRGCYKCGIASLRSNTEEFVSAAKVIHGDKYDYSLVEYVLSSSKVKILCKTHNEIFLQTPSAHLSRCGCPKCSPSSFDIKAKAILYVLYSGGITKRGITNRCVNSRLSEINSSVSGCSFSIVKKFCFETGEDARYVELIALKELRSLYKSPCEKFDGYTECFLNTNADFVISIIENIIRSKNE